MFFIGEGMAGESVWHRLQMNQGRLVIRSTEKRSNKMADSSIPVSLLFFCLTLLCKFQTHFDSSGEKQFTLTVRV